jgi:hypothetical protein
MFGYVGPDELSDVIVIVLIGDPLAFDDAPPLAAELLLDELLLPQAAKASAATPTAIAESNDRDPRRGRTRSNDESFIALSSSVMGQRISDHIRSRPGTGCERRPAGVL